MRFFVPGKPTPKGRPRCTCKGGKPRMYTPASTVVWEKMVATLARHHWQGEPLDCPAWVRIEIRQHDPKCTEGEPAHKMRCDVDNVAKSVLDALNGIAYVDDRRVTRLEVVKHKTRGEGGVWVEIKEDEP